MVNCWVFMGVVLMFISMKFSVCVEGVRLVRFRVRRVVVGCSKGVVGMLSFFWVSWYFGCVVGWLGFWCCIVVRGVVD